MKVIKHEHGIELIPENSFEEECLRHIGSKALVAKFEDAWSQKGNLRLEFEPHPWDKNNIR